MNRITIEKITLETGLGALEDYAREALHLANKYHCKVEFIFNRHLVTAKPSNTIDDVVDSYRNWQGTE